MSVSRLLIRIIAIINIQWFIIDLWYSQTYPEERFLRWAHMIDASTIWLVASTYALPVLLIVDAVVSIRVSGAGATKGCWVRRHANILIDGALVLGWTGIALYIATHLVAWL